MIALPDNALVPVLLPVIVLVIVLVLEDQMPLSHERLDVYRRAIEFPGCAHELLTSLKSDESGRSQLERAATSIPLNITSWSTSTSTLPVT